VSQAYAFNQVTFSNGTVKGDGTGQTIAIIDAYNQPNITSDLANFDTTYGLQAPPSFKVVGENGGAVPTGTNTTWGEETSLDVEWAHAIAPGANILLVEATSNSWTDLWAGVNYARNQPGVAAVSMSWGGPEWSGDTGNDGYFTTPSGHSGITFLAATGDSGSGTPNYPAVSANVVAVGGTVLSADGSGNYLSETAWSGSVGGISQYESQPSWQKGVVTQTSTQRAIPDVAYNSSTGYAVYDTDGLGGWVQLAGTSAASPQWAALVAIADQGRVLAGETALDGATQTLPALYGLPASDFHDITTGGNGSYTAGPGYDLVTGRGTPIANLVVGGLVSYVSGQPGGPTITAGPSASPSTVTGKTTNLSVQASENGSSSGLTYTWAVTAAPAGANTTFSVNGTSSANNTTATFSRAGNYTFQVTVTDSSNQSATGSVTVLVNQTLTGVGVTPATASVNDGASQRFAATAYDRFGQALVSQPSWSWAVTSGAGSVDGTGLYTAPGSGSGSATVQATTGGKSGTATVSYSGSAVPANPANLTVTSSSANAVSLSWTESSPGVVNFVFERCSDGVSFSYLASLPGNPTTWTDTTVSPSNSYYYRVYALNYVGHSMYSNVASTVTPAVVAVGQQSATGIAAAPPTKTAATTAPVAASPAPVTPTAPATVVTTATAPASAASVPQTPPASNHPAANTGADLWGSMVWQLFLEDSTLIAMLLKAGSAL
jgi:hypothetical protein